MHDAVEDLFRATGLTGPPHVADEALVLRALAAHYDMHGRLTRLDTEKDSTFRFTGRRGAADGVFLVKVSQPDEPAAVVACQVEVVGFVQRQDAGIRVQGVVPDTAGKLLRPLLDDAGRSLGLLRVQEYIPGTLLADAAASPEQLREVGATLGRLDVALRGFEHEGEQRALVWDLSRFPSLRPLVELEADPARRELALRAFDGFEQHVSPRLGTARTQVIHGDFSPYNVIVEPDAAPFVHGVIDFGDAIRTAVVFDPAVLLANHLHSAPLHPWAAARELLAGYRRELPLSDVEVDMLIHATLARVALRALVANWRIARGTEREAYIRSHARHDWGRLESALRVGAGPAFDYLMHATP